MRGVPGKGRAMAQNRGMGDRLVTLVGGSGFLGRYVAQEIMKTGARLVIASRDPRRAHYLKPLGGLGQIAFVSADITRPASLARLVQPGDAVVNLVGVLKGNFHAVHGDAAETVARLAAEGGAGALVHVSAIGADADSPSAYGRSKAAGEEKVRAAFPHATILRPSILFGREDDFINRFARLMRLAPAMPVIRGATRFQPAFVADVAKAVAMAALEPARFGGVTFELGGPERLSMREIMAWTGEATGRPRALLEVPDAAARMLAKFTGWLPGAPITSDQLAMLSRDNVVADGARGFEAFGISPRPLSAVAETWLVPFRKQGRFAKRTLPV